MTPDEAKKRHEQLAAEIRAHDHAYYVLAKPRIGDAEYDRLYRELLDLERAFPSLQTPDSPSARVGGQPLDGFRPVQHAVPMMSLDNTYSEEEVREFVRRVEKLLPGEALTWLVEPKVDGVAVSLRYEQGRLTVGATRGDGTTGDDITANLRTIRGLPVRLAAVPAAGPGTAAGAPFAGTAEEVSAPVGVPAAVEVRGEVYFSKSGFARWNAERESAGEEPFANPRNAAAGSLKQLDSRVVARRPLGIRLYGLGELSGPVPATQFEALAWLGAWGFPTPERIWRCHSVGELLEAIHELDRVRRDFDYGTDGAVIKLDAMALRERAGLKG